MSAIDWALAILILTAIVVNGGLHLAMGHPRRMQRALVYSMAIRHRTKCTVTAIEIETQERIALRRAECDHTYYYHEIDWLYDPRREVIFDLRCDCGLKSFPNAVLVNGKSAPSGVLALTRYRMK